MTAYSTTVRATHLPTNAAWFGGSLIGAVALNPAAREGGLLQLQLTSVVTDHAAVVAA